MMVLGQEPRQTTSNLGHLQKPSVQVSKLFNIIFLTIIDDTFYILQKIY